MLIKLDKILQLLRINNIEINGILHIGANKCEEKNQYSLCVDDNDIIWVEADQNKITDCINNFNINVYKAIISSSNNEDVIFNVCNIEEYSSILELGSLMNYKNIHYIKQVPEKTSTIASLYDRYKLNKTKYNFWNINISGNEYNALKNSFELFDNVDVLYLKVYNEHLYANCALVKDIDNLLIKTFKRIITSKFTNGCADALYINLKKLKIYML